MPAPSTPPQAEAPADPSAAFASMLASGERVLEVRRRHWFTFVDAGRWFVGALGIGVLVLLIDSGVPNDGIAGSFSAFLGWVFWAFLLIGLVGVGWYYVAWRVERYLVTTRRVIEAGGVINKYTRDTTLAMITDMIVSHPWLGRIIGFGEIELLTGSEAGRSKIKYLPHADEFKKSLLDAKHEYELEVGGGRIVQEAVTAAVASAEATVSDTQTATGERLTGAELDSALSHLDDLRTRGLITDAEFDVKKRELLDRL